MDYPTMDDRTFFARTTVACLKPGKREEANRIILELLNK
jgi:hypothetical protein